MLGARLWLGYHVHAAEKTPASTVVSGCLLTQDASMRRTYAGLSDGAYVFLVQSVTLTAILGPATETDFTVDTSGPTLTNVSVTVGCVSPGSTVHLDA